MLCWNSLVSTITPMVIAHTAVIEGKGKDGIFDLFQYCRKLVKEKKKIKQIRLEAIKFHNVKQSFSGEIEKRKH